MVSAERSFSRLADEASRPRWSYEAALGELRSSLQAVARASGLERDAALKAAQQRAKCFTVLKKLAVELDLATGARLGTDSPIEAAIAFRVPETNINLAASLARAKTTVQISCLPDDSAPLLGPNGFNKGKVGAGDLALSVKM